MKNQNEKKKQINNNISTTVQLFEKSYFILINALHARHFTCCQFFDLLLLFSNNKYNLFSYTIIMKTESILKLQY